MSNLHPLNRADAEMSLQRIARVRAGLAGPDLDRWFYTDIARCRIDALEADADFFGLLPHEKAELTELKDLLQSTTLEKTP